MYKPGISRAVVMGVIGFLVGGLVVMGVRALQSLTPFWDPGVGLVFATFFTAGFFLWGIGAFDLRLSAHGEGAHDEPTAAELAQPKEPAQAMGLFSSTIWQVAFALLIFIIALAVFAELGPTLVTTADPLASTKGIGMFPVTIGDTDLVVSELVVFAVFIIFTLVSLAIAGLLISMVFSYLSRGIVELRGGTAALPAPSSPQPEMPLTTRDAISFAVKFLVIFVVLYVVFFYVAIGLVVGFLVPGQTWLTALLSIVNALVVTLLILRPMWLVSIIAKLSKWLAVVLRGGNRVDGTSKIDRRNRP